MMIYVIHMFKEIRGFQFPFFISLCILVCVPNRPSFFLLKRDVAFTSISYFIVHFTTRDIHHSCIHNYKFYILKAVYNSWDFDGND